MSSDGKVAFSVVAQWSGRKYKMTLCEKDVMTMKVDKIKRTLSKFTSVPPDEFGLRTDTGKEIVVGMKGQDFGLTPGVVLFMYRIEPRTGATANHPPPLSTELAAPAPAGHIRGHAAQGHSPAAHPQQAASPNLPSPPVGRLTPPPPEDRDGRGGGVSPLAPLPLLEGEGAAAAAALRHEGAVEVRRDGSRTRVHSEGRAEQLHRTEAEAYHRVAESRVERRSYASFMASPGREGAHAHHQQQQQHQHRQQHIRSASPPSAHSQPHPRPAAPLLSTPRSQQHSPSSPATTTAAAAPRQPVSPLQRFVAEPLQSSLFSQAMDSQHAAPLPPQLSRLPAHPQQAASPLPAMGVSPRSVSPARPVPPPQATSDAAAPPPLSATSQHHHHHQHHHGSAAPSPAPAGGGGGGGNAAFAAPGSATRLWDSSTLSQEQNRLQERLLQEYEALSKEQQQQHQHHHRRGTAAPTAAPPGSVAKEARPRAHSPSPSAPAGAAKQGPPGSAGAAAPTGALEARIRELRVENAKLRMNASSHGGGGGAGSSFNTSGAASAAGGSPRAEPWRGAGAPSPGHNNPNSSRARSSTVEASGTPSPLFLRSASQTQSQTPQGVGGVPYSRMRAMTPPPQVEPPAAEGDIRGLVVKCNELARTRHRLEVQLDEIKSEWTGERRSRMSQWESEHRDWARRLQDLINSWEDDKQALFDAGPVEPLLLLNIHEKWEQLKRGPTPAQPAPPALNGGGGWQVGGGGVPSVQQQWEREKAVLVEEVQQLARVREEAGVRRVQERRGVLERLRAKKRDGDSELQQLKQGLSKSRHDTEQNKLFVVAASQSLDSLRHRVHQVGSTSPDEAKSLVTAVTEKAMLTLRVSNLRVQHENLSQSLQRETALRKHLHNTLEDIKGCIRAIVRMRPVLPQDLGDSDSDSAAHPPVVRGSVSVRDNTVVVSSPTTGTKEYSFYRALPPTAGQEAVFAEIRPLLQSTIDGFNACVMAYGQTGSGKTFTIMGNGNPHTSSQRGVLPRAVEELFSFVKRLKCEYRIRCSMVELYLDSLHDLLTPDQKKCELRQLPSGLQITCTDREVSNLEETLQLLKDGTAQRQVHSTLINPKSSRSHAVFTLALSLRVNGDETMSKLSFVDLAGSERVKVSHSKGDRLKEAQMINKSLSALGDVVASLSQRGVSRNYVPYRNSKLTMILQEALGGNSKTVLFACVCPSECGVSNISETVSTLGFASRVKHVYNPYLRNITRVQNKAMTEALDEDPEEF